MLFRKSFQKFLIIIFLTFTISFVNAEENSAQKEPSGFRSWFDWDTATGNWNGYRTELKNKGVTISSTFTTDVGANPIGGLKKSLIYSGFFDVSVDLDFEKMASLKGTALTISNYLASGQNLSAKIGNFFGVQEIYTAGNYFFGELDLSQSLMNDKLVVEIGRLFAGDVFALSDLWQYYVSGGINGNFASLQANVFFPVFNIAAWAARLTFQPNKNWQIVAGIYNADGKVKDPDEHGLYFKLNTNKGYLAISQITYKHHQKKEDNNLPGSISLGGYYQSSKFQYLSDSSSYRRGNYGFYAVLDQMIYRGDWPEFFGPSHLRSDASYAERVKHSYRRQVVVPKDRPMGLTAWFGGYVAPLEKINTQLYQITGGLLYQGLFSSRNQDVAAFCFILGKFSDQLERQGSETVLELNYRFQIGPWFYITPDLQYIIKPNGQTNIPNALVLGFESSINF
ncbi:MAG: carbohydrate porin [Parachlamydiales bacterium]|nr:carbohydrate porin [Parachlamydiales bacterium]